MIRLYRITQTENGKPLGKYSAEDEFGALDAMALLQGFPTFAQLADQHGFEGKLRVELDSNFDYAAVGRECGEESAREHAEENSLTKAEIRWLLSGQAQAYLAEQAMTTLAQLARESRLDPNAYQLDMWRKAYMAGGLEYLEKKWESGDES